MSSFSFFLYDMLVGVGGERGGVLVLACLLEFVIAGITWAMASMASMASMSSRESHRVHHGRRNLSAHRILQSILQFLLQFLGKIFIHPIKFIGWWLMILEKILRRDARHNGKHDKKSGKKQQKKSWQTHWQTHLQVLAGMVYLLLAIAPATLLFFITLPMLVEVAIVAFMLAGGSLFFHVADVAKGLDKSLPQGQANLQKIVSRDAKKLDRGGVARSALESLSENFSDGVVAPVFFYFFFGLPGMVIYKIVNTADSMVGYTDQRYFYFGKISARVDDILNLIPARITALFYLLAGLLVAPKRFFTAIAITCRHAGKHASPNSGWPEAALAGIMNLQLGGRRIYPGNIVKDTTIGVGRANLTVRDMRIGMVITAIAFVLLFSAVFIYGAVYE